jgi:sigma-B regulation protein RsbU (phosphoserine phosphatase)
MHPLLPSVQTSLSALGDSLRERVHSCSEISRVIADGAEVLFPGTYISIYLQDPTQGQIVDTRHVGTAWVLGDRDRAWLVQQTKEHLIKSERSGIIYIPDRAKYLALDKLQQREDHDQYGECSKEILFQVLISEDELILGIVVIRGWGATPLSDMAHFDVRKSEFAVFSKGVALALEDLYIHQKIESLLIDKRELKLRIQKDEEDLKRRILELTVLYDTSNALGYSLDYYQIVRLVVESLAKVLNFDICAIFLLDFVSGGEIVTRINKPLEDAFVNSVQSNVVSAIAPFVRRAIDPLQVKLTTELGYRPSRNQMPSKELMKSFANVPLIFKEEVIGMLNICSTSRNAFPRNEMTFLHTMANQLASHLGRLKVVKNLEKSKMDSVIKSMSEAVIMTDDAGEVEFINPAARELLEIPGDAVVSKEELSARYVELGIDPIYRQSLRTRKSYLNQEVIHRDRIYLVNATPVMDGGKERVGTVLVIRDFTEIQKNNRIKTQRLEAISQVNVIIKSITDLDNMLSVLMQFILNVVNAESGAIQLKDGKKLVTKVHSNFPDKIRREYQFKSGETISEFVSRNADICFIEDYHADPRVCPDVKVLIESYVCIPIMVKNDLIGVVSIVRKYGNMNPKITQDDIRTLTTITSLSGTAIQNALLYRETLKKQQIDQELRIATEIHTKLLPLQVPELDYFLFGAISIPARGLGGDYYDFFKLDDGKIGICVADIVGKGIPAGLFMAMLKSLLHSQLKQVVSPKIALQKINEVLFRDPVIDKFVPLFYAVLDPATMKLRYSNAGHEPALRFNGTEFEVLDTEGFPLGGLLDSEYGEHEIQLCDKDVVVFFTDGIVDARNSKNHSFGVAGVKAVLKKFSDQSAKGITDKLFSHVSQFMKGMPQPDDISIVVLKTDMAHHVLGTEQPLRVKKMRVTSSTKFIKKVRAEVEQIAIDMGFPEEDIFNIKLAINEAHANVIEHAYAGSDTGDILFQFMIFSDRLEVVIKDFGQGMGSRTTKGEEYLDELEGSGLGVFLIKTVMDRVRYRRTSKVGT